MPGEKGERRLGRPHHLSNGSIRDVYSNSTTPLSKASLMGSVGGCGYFVYCVANPIKEFCIKIGQYECNNTLVFFVHFKPTISKHSWT